MKLALIHTGFEHSKLERVTEEMKTLGPPVLRGIWCAERDFWVLLEGCHRTRAAARLGLEPIIQPVEYTPGMTWDDAGMSEYTHDYSITLKKVWEGAGKELVIGFGEDGPPALPDFIGPPRPGETMRYRIIKNIGFDFGGKIYSGIGTEFTSDETCGKDVTDYVTLRYIEIVDDGKPEKQTKPAGVAPKRKYQRRG